MNLDLFADTPAPTPAVPPFTMAELVKAWEDCRRSKRSTASAKAFAADIERNLCRLRARLLDGSYQPGRSKCFVITHPRPREVWASGFEDRVVHHLLYNHIGPRFEASFDIGSAACIKGRGTLYAAQRLEHDVRSITRNWSRPAFYLKCDLANFFVAIHKPTLQTQIHTKVPEPFWRRLADTVLMHDPRADFEQQAHASLQARVPPHKRLLLAPAQCGLPIGNLSSQFFANIYLNALDQFVKHKLRARYYGRYVDDFYLLHESPQQLNEWLAAVTAYVPERLGVHLNPRKTIQQPLERGIDFVGHVIKPWRRTTRPRAVAMALRRLERMPAADVFAAGNSYLAMAGQASHGHTDQARIAKALTKRGHAVAGDLSKIFRRRGSADDWDKAL